MTVLAQLLIAAALVATAVIYSTDVFAAIANIARYSSKDRALMR